MAKHFKNLIEISQLTNPQSTGNTKKNKNKEFTLSTG